MSWLQGMKGSEGANANAAGAASIYGNMSNLGGTPTSAAGEFSLAPAVGPLATASPETGGVFSKIGSFLASDKGKQAMELGTQSGQQASATAHAAGQQAADQAMREGMSASGSYRLLQPFAVTPPPSNYDPMQMVERLAAFRRQ